MNRKKQKRTGFVISTILVLLTLLFTLQSKGAVQSDTLKDNAYLLRPEHYGIVYLYPPTGWDQGLEEEVELVLAKARDWGVTTILQIFPASLMDTPGMDQWFIFLDAAASKEIDVIAYLWPNTTYPVVDKPFEYDDLKRFIDIVGDHPALIGYIGLHEPLDPNLKISSSELRVFYREMKNYAPRLLLAHYMEDIAYAEEHRKDGWKFSEEMCDLCILWYYPFENVNGQPVFNQEKVEEVMQTNIDIITERDTNAQLWFLGQTFTVSDAFPRRLRMPNASEMEMLYLQVMKYPVHGFFWYPWSHSDIYNQVLGDQGMEEQQEMVGLIGNSYVRQVAAVYLPVLINEYDH